MAFATKVRNIPWAKKSESVDGQVRGVILVRAGETVTVDVAYGSQGMDRWSYRLTPTDKVASCGISVSRSRRTSTPSIFQRTPSPPRTRRGPPTAGGSPGATRTCSPGEHRPAHAAETAAGATGRRDQLRSGVAVFFVVMLVITLVRRIELHPMHYFFPSGVLRLPPAAGLPGGSSVHPPAFAIASLVSVALVVSYLRLAVGSRFAFVEAGAAQMVYLVLFSYAFFFRGSRGWRSPSGRS